MSLQWKGMAGWSVLHPKLPRSSSSSSIRDMMMMMTMRPSRTRANISSSPVVWLRQPTLRVDPSTLVDGVTMEQYESNETIRAYIQANFPDAFEKGGRSSSRPNEPHTQQHNNGHVKKTKSEEIVYPLNIRPLTCYLRDPKGEEGSRRCQTLRDHNFIPGLLYGGDPGQGIYSHQPHHKTYIKTEWRVLERELVRYHRHFESRVYDVTILDSPDDTTGGTVHRVLPKNVQRHPVKSTIFCANFIRYHPGRPIQIPVVYINEEESPTLKHDGFIIPIHKFVECFVEDGVSIPERLELDCTGLTGKKQVLRVDRLIVPEGVRFSDRIVKRGDEFIVGVMSGKAIMDPAGSAAPGAASTSTSAASASATTKSSSSSTASTKSDSKAGAAKPAKSAAKSTK